MERVDMWMKLAVVLAGTTTSAFLGGLKYAFPALLVLMFIDFITGMMAAVYTGGGLKSDMGRKGFIRKLYIVLLIGSVYIIEQVLGHSVNSYFTFDIPLGHIGNGVSVSYAVIEFLSITENGGRMGAPIPGVLRKIIAVLKDQVGDEGSTKVGGSK